MHLMERVKITVTSVPLVLQQYDTKERNFPRNTVRMMMHIILEVFLKFLISPTI